MNENTGNVKELQMTKEKDANKKLKTNEPLENVQKHRALLTQRSQSDTCYEEFTIHPMYTNKQNKSATELYQMLKVEDLALDFRYKALDLKCYPSLYPYGINGQREERVVCLTEFEYIKLRLMSRHPRFRLNQQYLFFLLNDSNIRQLNSGIFHKMNVTNAH